MHVVILGSAAGGGLPQWNCRCPICALAREDATRVRPRTQSSIAVSPDGERWLLVNASPDIRQQLFDNPAMHPRTGLRHSPIHAVLLSHNHYDHMDVPTLRRLRDAHDPVIYTPRGHRRLLERAGIARVRELGWWEGLDLGDGSGGARSLVDHGHFAEEIFVGQHAQGFLLAGTALLRDLHRAAGDEVKAVAGVVLEEDHFAGVLRGVKNTAAGACDHRRVFGHPEVLFR